MMRHMDKWQVGAAAVVVVLAVLACKGGKSGDSSDAGQVAATASATPDPVASDEPDTSVVAKPVVKPKPAAICKAGYTPGTFEGLTMCRKQCKKDSDCENPPCSGNLCMSDDEEPTLAQAAAAKPKAAPGKPVRATPGPTVDQVSIETSTQGDPQQSCPVGWIGLPGGQCNRPCKADGDCHGSNKCQKLGAERFCDNQKWD